jgi:hypothetical protein
METQFGMHGATYQSWHGDAIRVIFREIQREHPRANEKLLIKILAERLAEEPDTAKAAAEYIVKNMINVQRGYSTRARRAATPQQRAQREAETNAAAEAGVNKILLLNYPMPNGKRLRHCTGTYVKKLGGGWTRIGNKAGTKEIGQVFDENSLRECMAVDVEQ